MVVTLAILALPRTTWSDLTSSQADRAAFIASLQSSISQNGLQGVDIDWQYPGTPESGGCLADTEDHVSLVTEMRAIFGTQYGISLTLTPGY